jgi:hypothetical protein
MLPFKWAIFLTYAHKLFLLILQMGGRFQKRGWTNNLRPIVVEVILFPLVQYMVSTITPLISAHSKSGIDWASYLIPNVDLIIPLDALQVAYSKSTPHDA